MEATEGLAVVEIHPTIGHIQGVQRRGESFAEILAKGKIEGRVLRQIVPRIRLPGKALLKPEP